MASAVRRRHGSNHGFLGSLLVADEGYTPGVEMSDKATILLSDDSEPQPDLYLRILPEFSGQSRTTASDYVEGALELVAEIAQSSRAINLHVKRDDYAPRRRS